MLWTEHEAQLIHEQQVYTATTYLREELEKVLKELAPPIGVEIRKAIAKAFLKGVMHGTAASYEVAAANELLKELDNSFSVDFMLD